MISKFFIERPVLANVLAVLMIVIGGVALFQLPVAQYPNVVPPTISVTTRYPGAGARAVIDTVALPIEQQVNGVDGMIYMQSYSASDGSYTLIVTFKIGTDINFAQVLVQNQQVTAGQLGMPPGPNTQAFQYTLDIAARLDDVSQFENIVVKTEQNGQMVYLRDVGRVELGAQTYSQVFTLNGKPSAGIGVYQTLEANALDVAGEVATKMAQLSKNFPQGLSYTMPLDTTTFVRASINEVWKTLFEAAILVLIVIVVFLQDWRAMLVPMTTVTVTIIGAF